MRCLSSCVLAAVIAVAVFLPALHADEPRPAEKPRCVVGTFDSRSIAIAYARSEYNAAYLKTLRARHEAAKAAGDEKAIESIEAEAQAHQHRLHQQGFSTASVRDLLKHVEAKIPGVAKAAGVDLVVSRWDLVHEGAGARVVDVTMALANLYDPDERTRKILNEVPDHEPVPLDEIDEHTCR